MEIGLLQVSEKRAEHNYLPYTIGLLQAYALKHARNADDLHFRLPLFSRLSIPEALEQLAGVDVAAFSVYIWNLKRSLAIAAALKVQQPDTLIIMGGPQIPHDALMAETFLKQNPFVDVLVQGEGEVVFLQLLEAWPARDWLDIPSLAWIDQDGFHQTPRAERIRDLDTVPSPYIAGVFEPLYEKFPEIKWVAIWETNRGCPFSCAFCDWGGLTRSKVFRWDLERIKQEIDWFAQHKIESVFCADANFGILPRDPEIVKAVAAAKAKYGFPGQLQTQTAKNVRLRNFEIHRLLVEFELNPIASLSLQSLHPPTLEAIKRDNISTEVYRELQAYCLEHGIYSYTDLIIGLPEETYDSFVNNISKVIEEMGQHNKILFHNAAILPNAEMGNPEYLKKYEIETLAIPFPGQQKRDHIQETIDIVVQTRTMPRQDWILAQSFAWMTNFLYYGHKPLQPFLLILHHASGIGFKQLLNCFFQPAKLKTYPVLLSAYNHLIEMAAGFIQYRTTKRDSPHLFAIEDGVYLTPEMTLQKEITRKDLWPQFFKEVGHLCQMLLLEHDLDIADDLFQDALRFSQAHFHSQYFGDPADYCPAGMTTAVSRLHLRYNLGDFYESCLTGSVIPLQKQASVYSYLTLVPEKPSAATKLLNETSV